MAKEVFNNHDLLRSIYSFGSVDHREKTKKVCDSLLFRTHSRTDKLFGKSHLSLVPNLMKYHRDWRLYADFFANKRCMCCSRHSHRKPNIYIEEGILVFKQGNKTMVPEAIGKKDCECECRHTCRNIIRMLTDTVIN
jgi:hypothetical protein